MKKFIATIALLSIAGLAQGQTTTPARGTGVMREGVKPPVNRMMPRANVKISTSTKPKLNTIASTTKAIPKKQTARKDIALEQKEHLVKRLTLALDSLTKTRTNLNLYIEKRIAAGQSVGNAKTLLATATTKIETARKAIAAVVAWKPDVKAGSSTEISLVKPRETANAAIKAVQEARLAMHEVIKELRGKVKPETATTTNNQ